MSKTEDKNKKEENQKDKPSDFNDLHVLAGLDAVKEQINAKIAQWQADSVADIKEGSPTPSKTSEVSSAEPLTIESCALSIEQVCERFALIVPTTNVWDAHEKAKLKKTEFMALVGAKVGKKWWDGELKRQVREADVAKSLALKETESNDGLANALRRYVYLNPSQTVWDNKRRQLTPIADLKYAIPNEYPMWVRHPNRLQIEKENLVFDPTQKADPDSHINMFQGLPLKPVNNDDGCMAIRQMMYQLCNCDDEVWTWLSKWLAFPLQHVGAKMATAVLMHSDVHGSGKSLLFDGVMRPIYGEYGATLGQTQMESQYTDWSSNLLYGLFEEVFSRDQKYSHMGTIKQMITGEKQRIEKKFMSGWEEANHMNCIFLSNELLPFPIEPSDRRFLVIWPNWKLDPELQKQVSNELKNGGVEAFMGWLLKVDTSDFDEHTKPPMTEAKKWIIDFGRPGWDKFYQEWSANQLDLPYCSCLTTELWEGYRHWCRSNGIPKVMDNQKFPRLMEKRVHAREAKQPWRFANKQHQGTVYLTEPVPVSVTKKDWLGEQVMKFRNALNTYIEDAQNV